MPIAVRTNENVAVWNASGSVSLLDLKKAFADTAVVRERHPGKARLLVIWNTEVPAALRAELTEIHERTAGIFERLAFHGPAMTQAALTARVVMAKNIGAGVRSTQSLDQALAYIGEGLDEPVAAWLAKHRDEMGASMPPSSPRDDGGKPSSRAGRGPSSSG
jgi:hypothetical protein